MAPRRKFRALSLDLWFTVLSYDATSDRHWLDARTRAVSESVRRPDGGRFDDAEILGALDGLRHAAEKRGLTVEMVPSDVVQHIADTLGGRLARPLEEVARRYSDAGLAEHPPILNPEVVDVVPALERKGIPVVVVSNTARSEATWHDVLRSLGAPPFRSIVTSCEARAGKPRREIFDEAARRLAVAPEEILHVGDRWTLDVEGALAAGLGAGLYRGLWPLYPPDEPADVLPPERGDRDVLVLDRLADLLRADLWDARAGEGRPTDGPSDRHGPGPSTDRGRDARL
jgi:FMN phosphatase YigB (HAD superfamily)